MNLPEASNDPQIWKAVYVANTEWWEIQDRAYLNAYLNTFKWLETGPQAVLNK